MAKITQKQKDISRRVVQHMENKTLWREQVLENIRKEHANAEKQAKAQKPTEEQMKAPFNL